MKSLYPRRKQELVWDGKSGFIGYLMIRPPGPWLNYWRGFIIDSMTFKYRRKITITEQSGNNLSDYQVRIDLDATNFDFSHFLNEGKDLRFADASKNLLPYWVEKMDISAQQATIWVKVPSMPANSSVEIYMYYGNSAVDSASNGEATFVFFDDFEGKLGEEAKLKWAAENAASYLTTPTYDGSGQVVHPSVIYFPDGWNGYKYWMAMTPYPGSDASKENPSILASNDGLNWEEPPGLTNPIEPAPASGHYADPNLIYNPDTDELWVYFSWAGTDSSKIYLKRSSDGINWTEKEEVADGYLQCGSPAVVKEGNNWYMWRVHVDASKVTTLHLYTSTDGKNWIYSTQCSFDYIPAGKEVWDFEVKKVGDEYWGLFSFCDYGAPSEDTVLYFAKSSDRVNWTLQREMLLGPSSGGWDDGQIYKSSLLFFDPIIKIWYSALGTNGEWHVGYTEANKTNAKWRSYNSPDITFTDSIIKIAGGSKGFAGIASLAPFSYGHLFRCKVRYVAPTALFGAANIDSIGDDYVGIAEDASDKRYFTSRNEGTSTYTTETPPELSNFHIDEISLIEGRVDFWRDGTHKYTHTTNIPNEDLFVRLAKSSLVTGSEIWADWILVRKYSPPEPSVSIHEEELA